MTGSNIEKGPERFPEREEVVEAIKGFAEDAQITKEGSDERGLYLLRAEVRGEAPGEVIEYEYTRKGDSSEHKNVSETAIHRTYYQDSIPTHGYKVLWFSDGRWLDAKENPK